MPLILNSRQSTSPRQGAWEALGREEQDALECIADEVRTRLHAGQEASAVAYIRQQGFSADLHVAFWSLLGSKERSALKRAGKA